MEKNKKTWVIFTLFSIVFCAVLAIMYACEPLFKDNDWQYAAYLGIILTLSLFYVFVTIWVALGIHEKGDRDDLH